MYGLSGKFTASTGQRESLLAILLEGVAFLGQLDGCYAYIISRAVDDPDGIWVTEVWRSREDHQDSLGFDAVQAMIARARPMIAGMSDRVEFEPVGGKGIPSA
jgi:quinol monooxygenase YgiN